MQGFWEKGARHKAQGTRHKAQGTRHKAQGTRHKAQGTRKVRDLRIQRRKKSHKGFRFEVFRRFLIVDF
jgi:hypothetical protein